MKKYRTKSGKVEEKLPGINATVSPSEKVQIAMAGGANTLSDVQTILGISGKKNNLKGQGAKHLVSFNGDEDFGGDFGSYDTEAASDVNQGAVDAAESIAAGIGGSYSGRVNRGGGFQDPSAGEYEAEGDEGGGGESTIETIKTGIRQAQQTITISALEQIERGKSALDVAKERAAGLIPGVYSELTAYEEDQNKPATTGFSPFELLGTVGGAVFGLGGPGGQVGSMIDKQNRADERFATIFKENELRQEAGLGSLVSLTNPFGSRDPWTPTPTTGGDDSTPISKKKKKKPLVSDTKGNGVTLATVGPGRGRLRQQQGGFRRYV